MATIYDVAKECGFSLATVSNVVNNGNRPVKPETRRRILEAVDKLGYHPNAVARRLARQRTHTLGILFGVVESSAIVINAYSAAILQAVLSEASESGYDVMHVTTRWQGRETSIGHFRDGRTDGFLVVAPPTDSDLIPALASLPTPLVAVSWTSQSDGVPAVDVDDDYGAHLLMDHLLGLGHRRIAHITGHPNLLSAQIRQQVYLDRMQQAGQVVGDLLRLGQYSADSGFEHASALLKLRNRPTAIFAANDEIAMGVLEAASHLGISVPTELSLVGVDDRPASTLIKPALTTLHQPFDELGRTATRLLIDRIEGREVAAEVHLFKPRLVVRDSTAPPPTL